MAAATLTGTVTENQSGRPLARCQVVLIRVQNGYDMPQPGQLTGSSGQFRFDRLPAGTYFLSVRRPGFAESRFGQRRPTASGTPILLEEESEFTADFRLRRLGAVSGRVLDENGVGLPGNRVAAYLAGRLAATAASDDRGVYRIAGLEPGSYYLRSGAQELEDRRGLLPTAFGQTVAVDLDHETTGIDIQPKPGQLARLEVKPASGSLRLYSETGVSTPRGEGIFDELAPGDYELLGEGVYQQLKIKEGLNRVTLVRGSQPLVRVQTDAPDGARAVTVTLTRTGLSSGVSQRPLQIPAGNGLTVIPGEYAVTAETGRDLYVKAIRPAAQIVARPGEVLDIVVTTGSMPAALSGKVLLPGMGPVPGAPVFLTSADPDLRSRIGGVRPARAGQDGSFRLPGLPPGVYQIASSFELQSPSYADLQGVPVKVISLEEGQEATEDLELSGGM